MTTLPASQGRTAGVFYLASGATSDPLPSLQTFVDSYRRYPAGTPHRLFILVKNFANTDQLEDARAVLEGTDHTFIGIESGERDLGSYFIAAGRADVDVVCLLNTHSEILGEAWLHKLIKHLVGEVGLVGCTASYEAPQHHQINDNIPFPNPHIRTNAFALSRKLFLNLQPRASLIDKLSTHLFEHGPSNLSRMVVSEGLRVLMVGRDGRGYDTAEWPMSGVYRQGAQDNLLIADNRTRHYTEATIPEKKALHRLAWGAGSHGVVEIAPSDPEPADDEVHWFYRVVFERRPLAHEIEAWRTSVAAGELLEERATALVDAGGDAQLDPRLRQWLTQWSL